MGRWDVSSGCCHKGVGGAKGTILLVLDEDVFLPEEGKGRICEEGVVGR